MFCPAFFTLKGGTNFVTSSLLPWTLNFGIRLLEEQIVCLRLKWGNSGNGSCFPKECTFKEHSRAGLYNKHIAVLHEVFEY